MMTNLGYQEQDITITFSREFTPTDIRMLLDLNSVEQ
jgi:hypothetical protein